MITRKLLISAGMLFFAGTIGVQAEETAKPKAPASAQEDVLIHHGPGTAGMRMMFGPDGPVGPFGGGTFGWVASEMSFSGKPVKGAPYAAEAVTESTQTLIDGNRIQRKSTASVFRDSEGRTRREQTLSAIGPWAAAGEAPQTVFIDDAVAGVHYILNPKDRTARKISLPSLKEEILPDPATEYNDRAKATASPRAKGEEEFAKIEKSGNVAFGTAVAVPGQMMHFERRVAGPGETIAFAASTFENALPKPQTESLGKRVIEGIEAEGTRTTITLPPGQVGNELPIQIVSESWFSPELQVLVMSKNSDPRMGDTVYRLTGINRSEQPRSLFEVPADYKIEEGGPVIQRFKRARPEPGN